MSTDRNVVKKGAEKIRKYRGTSAEGEGDIDNYWCNWKLIRIISGAFRRQP
jgi:hypothetical protein